MRKIMLLLLMCLAVTGCGRKWEQLWGQDTRPETRYIPLTPDVVKLALSSDMVQWADKRFQTARYLEVNACDTSNFCVSVTEDDGDAMCFYTLGYGPGAGSPWLLTVYNAKRSYPWGTEIRVKLVM